MMTLWMDIAYSEMRLKLITELLKLKVGFSEVEEFCLGLNEKFRSSFYKENEKNPESKVKWRTNRSEVHYGSRQNCDE